MREAPACLQSKWEFVRTKAGADNNAMSLRKQSSDLISFRPEAFYVLCLTGLLLFFSRTGPVFSDERTLRLSSPDFEAQNSIPRKHTCDGANVSPVLRWKGAPARTQSYVLMMEDPDAPGGLCTHWILYDLPPTIDMLPGGVPPISKLANAEVHGRNNFGNLGYGGPCPPAGTHRYVFRIFALDRMLRLEPGANRAEVLAAMENRVLAQGELTGTYARQSKEGGA